MRLCDEFVSLRAPFGVMREAPPRLKLDAEALKPLKTKP